MRIALDATPLVEGVGGLARYTSQLVMALARCFPEDDFILVSDQRFALPCSAPNLRAGAGPRNLLERRWWTLGVQRELKRQRAEIFHGVHYAVPFPATLAAVMTIHDLSPWAKAKWVDEAWLARTARVRKRVPWLIRTGAARHIITPSEAVRREVMAMFRVDAERVTAIPLAAAEVFRPRAGTPAAEVSRPRAGTPAAEVFRPRAGTPAAEVFRPRAETAAAARPYFLYAGMLEPRKDVGRLLAAWETLSDRCDLVLAGPQREGTAGIVPRPGLKRRGVVSEEELAALYCGAVALVYPSLYEGFGLPVLEAMQCGTPVIISDDAALRETAGDAGLRVSIVGGLGAGGLGAGGLGAGALGAGALAEAMRALLDNGQLRGDLARRSLKRAAEFTWERTARATHEVYRSEVNRSMVAS